MVALPNGGFDAQEAIDADRFTPIPAGKYPGKFIASRRAPKEKEAIDNGEHTDKYTVHMMIEITDGDQAGRQILFRYPVVHPSEGYARKGRRLYGEASIATGFGQNAPGETDQLIGLPFIVELAVNPPKNGYEASNEIKHFIHPSAATAPAQNAASGEKPPHMNGATDTPAQTANNGAQPW